jgi:hypothetical protein
MNWRNLMKARTIKTLTSMALGVFRTLAAIMAPCSVKAYGNALEYFRFSRWSQFATTSAFSSFGVKNGGVHEILTFPFRALKSRLAA